MVVNCFVGGIQSGSFNMLPSKYLDCKVESEKPEELSEKNSWMVHSGLSII